LALWPDLLGFSDFSFTVAILIRLYNEVWSNTAAVGGYYGPASSAEFIGAALLFTAATLFYSIKAGMPNFTESRFGVITLDCVRFWKPSTPLFWSPA
jgi:hypothetical protein